MLHNIPRDLPPLSLMLIDIGQPHPAKLAKALDVTERTVYRWMASNQAPKAASLALWWLTRWGQSSVYCDLYNAAAMHRGLTAALRDENRKLIDELERVSAIAHFGSANDPSTLIRSKLQDLGVQLTQSPSLDHIATIERPRSFRR